MGGFKGKQKGKGNDVNPGRSEDPYDGIDNDCDPGTPDVTWTVTATIMTKTATTPSLQ